MTNTTRRRQFAGFSLLELQIAFVVLGIGLIGLGPLVMVQLKHQYKLEQRMKESTTYYLVPSSDAWTRKLGAAATLQTTESDISSDAASGTANDVSVLSFEKSTDGSEISVTVSLTPIPSS